MVFRLISVFVLVSFSLSGEGLEPVPDAGLGYLNARQELVLWPSPESVARELRSGDDGVRLNQPSVFLATLSSRRM